MKKNRCAGELTSADLGKRVSVKPGTHRASTKGKLIHVSYFYRAGKMTAVLTVEDSVATRRLELDPITQISVD